MEHILDVRDRANRAEEKLEKLEAAILKIEKAALAELKAKHSEAVAKDNFTNPEPEELKHERALIALHDAITNAVILVGYRSIHTD